MPIARLNRESLQILADSRVGEARVLLDNQYWTGAYYMSGLGVECALKACLARATQRHDFPDKNFMNKAYTHKLEDLARLDGELWVQLNDEIAGNGELRANWRTVRQWDDEKRYSSVEEVEAVSFFSAVTDPVSGLLEWIKRRW